MTRTNGSVRVVPVPADLGGADGARPQPLRGLSGVRGGRARATCFIAPASGSCAARRAARSTSTPHASSRSTTWTSSGSQTFAIPRDRALMSEDFERLLERVEADHQRLAGAPLRRALLLGRYLPEFARVPSAERLGLEIAGFDDARFARLALDSDMEWSAPYLRGRPRWSSWPSCSSHWPLRTRCSRASSPSLPPTTLFVVTYTNADSLPARMMRRYWAQLFDHKAAFLSTGNLTALAARSGLVLKTQYPLPVTRTSRYAGDIASRILDRRRSRGARATPLPTWRCRCARGTGWRCSAAARERRARARSCRSSCRSTTRRGTVARGHRRGARQAAEDRPRADHRREQQHRRHARHRASATRARPACRSSTRTGRAARGTRCARGLAHGDRHDRPDPGRRLRVRHRRLRRAARAASSSARRASCSARAASASTTGRSAGTTRRRSRASLMNFGPGDVRQDLQRALPAARHRREHDVQGVPRASASTGSTSQATGFKLDIELACKLVAERQLVRWRCRSTTSRAASTRARRSASGATRCPRTPRSFWHRF